MHIADYLKECRDRLGMTQDALAEALYLFDDRVFEGVTSTTVSRWERGFTAPSVSRIAGLLRFFQEKTRLPLPCVEAWDAAEVESLLCDERLHGLFRPKTMVADLDLRSDDFRVVNLRHHARAEEILEINEMLHRSVNTPFTQVGLETFKRWMEYPGHLFTTVMYKESFLGLLFSLRLKPESFEEVMAFERMKADLTDEDFAAPHEEGSVYMLSFFSPSLRMSPPFCSGAFSPISSPIRKRPKRWGTSPLSKRRGSWPRGSDCRRAACHRAGRKPSKPSLPTFSPFSGRLWR